MSAVVAYMWLSWGALGAVALRYAPGDAARTAALAQMWPHSSAFTSEPSSNGDYTATCNGTPVDFDPHSEPVNTSCFGTFVSMSRAEVGGRMYDTNFRCYGVLHASTKPANSSQVLKDDVYDDEIMDAAVAGMGSLRSEERSRLADSSYRAVGDISCEGESVVVSSSAQIDASARAGPITYGKETSVTAMIVCVGQAHSHQTEATDSSGQNYDGNDNQGDKLVTRVLLACSQEALILNISGPQGSEPSASDLQRVVANVRRSQIPAPHPPLPPTAEAMDHTDPEAWLALEGGNVIGDAAPSCKIDSGHAPNCEVTCNKKGLTWFGLWPCMGILDLKCSGTADGDVCYDYDMKCIGTSWPFWKQCDGTFLLGEETARESKGKGAQSVNGTSFHVGIGKTRLINTSYRQYKVNGLETWGHYSLHARSEMDLPKFAASSTQPTVKQLRIQM